MSTASPDELNACCRTVDMSVPSLAASACAFFRPVMTVEVSIPDFSRVPSRLAASDAPRPSSWNAVALVVIMLVSVSMLIPVFCPTTFRVSRKPEASDA